jgi:hypothetical protein
MNRIALVNLSGLKLLDNAEMSAVSGGLLSVVRLKRKYPVKLLAHRFLPPWVKVTLNPQPLPPR